MKREILFIIVLLVTSHAVGNSQQLDSNWSVYTPNTVYDMVDDGENLWIAGYGLKKINKDTEEVTYFNRNNSDFPADYIYSIAIDSSGNKWMGTWFGVIKYDDKEFIYYNYRNGFPIDSGSYPWVVSSIIVDSAGSIWMGSNKGLVIYDSKEWIKSDSSFAEKLQTDIYKILYYDGKYYFATRKGIFVLENNEWIQYSKKNSDYNEDQAQNIAIDSTGNLWVSNFAELYRFDGVNWDQQMHDEAPGNYISSIAVSKDNIIWVGDYYSGVYKFQNGDWNHLEETDKNYPGKDISCILSTGNIIYTSSSKGIYKNKSNEWHSVKCFFSFLSDEQILFLKKDRNELFIGTYFGATFYDLNSNNYKIRVKGYPVTAVTKTLDNREVIGTDNWGLLINNGEYFENFTRENSNNIINNIITDIIRDKSGDIWIVANFLSFFNSDTAFFIRRGEIPITFTKFTKIAIDDNNTKWIGTTEDGLVKYKDNWEIFRPIENPEKFYEISALSLDSTNKVWVGTVDQGLYSFYDNEWKNFSKENSQIQSDSISCLAVDEYQNIWIGTKDAGLIKYDSKTFNNFNSVNAFLLGNKINAIAIDNKDNKWIGTDQGLYLFNENSIVIDVKENEPSGKQFDVIIYPNPANDYIYIQNVETGLGLVSANEIEIYNVLGECVKTQQFQYPNPEPQTPSPKERVDVSDLPVGVYFVRIGDVVGRFVKY